MTEHKAEGVQAHALGAIDARAIFVVAQDGMVNHRHVHPNLVFAPGVKMQLDER